MVALLAAARLLHLSINILVERVSFCPLFVLADCLCHFENIQDVALCRVAWIPSLVKMPRDWRVWVNDSRVCRNWASISVELW